MEVPPNAGRLPLLHLGTGGTFLARPYGYRPHGFEFGRSSEEMSLSAERDRSQTGWHGTPIEANIEQTQRDEWRNRELSREPEDLPLPPVTNQEEDDNTWMYLVVLLLIISFVQISSF